MAETITSSIPETVPDILARIKELRKQANQHESELVRLNIELGLLFTRLKEKSAATWGAKLRKQGFNPRVVSRLMKAATVLTVDESVMERLLDRLPADPIKLESICALSLAQIEELVTDNDCRQLDRNEVADLVRDKQGKKAPEKRELSPSETIRQSWAQFVEGLLNKIAAVESPDERDQVRHDLEASLDDLKESLQETDDDEGDDGEDKEDQEEADENEPDEEAAKAEAAKSAQQKGGKRRMQPA